MKTLKDYSEKKSTSLSLLLEGFFFELEKSEVNFCIVGNYHTLPYYTDNDVDIWVSDIRTAKRLLIETAKDNGFIPLLWNLTSNGVNCFLSNVRGEVIHIDLLKNVAWRSFIPIISKDVLTENISNFNGIKVASDEIAAFGHLLYPLLTFGEVKKKYKAKIKMFCSTNKIFQDLIYETLGSNLAERILKMVCSENWDELAKVSTELKLVITTKFFIKKPLIFTGEFVKFLYFNFRKIIYPSGVTVAFVGTDGSGKSTLLENLKPTLAKIKIKENSRVRYWRPFILPKISTIIEHGKSKNKINEKSYISSVPEFNQIVSLIKFGYYFIDYLLGGIVARLLISRGGVILYDRHYDDLLVYPERFGMTLPNSVVKFCRLLLPQPDYVFYLKCSSRVLKERKKEIFDEELERQIVEYTKLESKYSNYHNINSELKTDELHNLIKGIIFKHVSRKAAKSINSHWL